MNACYFGTGEECAEYRERGLPFQLTADLEREMAVIRRDRRRAVGVDPRANAPFESSNPGSAAMPPLGT